MVRLAEIEEEKRRIQAEKEEWEVEQAVIDAMEATQKEEEEARKTEGQRQKEAEEREEATKEKEGLRKIQSTIEEEHHKESDELSEEECKLGIWDKYERDDYNSKYLNYAIPH